MSTLYRIYWESDAWYDQVCTIMSQDRFQLIKQYIHFNHDDKDKTKQMRIETDYSRYNHCF